MEEIWKDIPGFENLYQVSNLGRVKSLPKLHKLKNSSYTSKERLLKQHKNNQGYLRVNLNKKRCFVHRLVAQAFIPNINNKPFINHIDCNPLNNNVNNLEWCTPQENVDYMIKLKRNTRTKQWLNKLHNSQEKYYKSVKGTDKNGNTIILKNINEAKNYGMSPGTICACCKKIKNFKTYRGYTWEYVE
jgi:hypothetical protein